MKGTVAQWWLQHLKRLHRSDDSEAPSCHRVTQPAVAANRECDRQRETSSKRRGAGRPRLPMRAERCRGKKWRLVGACLAVTASKRLAAEKLTSIGAWPCPLRLPTRGGTTTERVTGIEPALSAWEAEVLPLNYTRTRHGTCVARQLGYTSAAE
jgi:hypothetical protein